MGTPLGTAPNGSPYNQVINGHSYWYQAEWSNFTHSCVQRVTLPKPLPTARETVTAGGGTNMTFDASQSIAPPTGVSDVQLAVQRRPQRRDRRADHADHHVHVPGAGAYSTGVAVFNPDGLSQGTGGIVVTGKNGFQPAFTVSTPVADGAVQRAHDRQRAARHELPLGVR